MNKKEYETITYNPVDRVIKIIKEIHIHTLFTGYNLIIIGNNSAIST